jgi:signal transduction histidine kinase
MQLSANLLDPQDPSQGIVVAAEDTSLRKQSETALIESRDLAEAALTELRSAQAQMIQSEKMASLGQLVASVAHEINTPIAVVKSSGESLADALKQIQASNADFGTLELETRLLFARLMEQSASPATVLSSRDARQVTREVSRQLSEAGVPEADHKARVLVLLNAQSAVQEYLPLLRHPRSEFILSRAEDSATMINGIANINMAVDRVSKIVFALKSYSRSDASGEMRQADVREGIDTVLTIYHNQIKQGTELVRQFETILPILCLPDELNQVWTNLIHNALQAMKNQGTLTVSVLQQGSEVVVSVADTGCGIPEAIRSRIFDPFFTTKPTGEGSGLGLDIVKKIVEKHQGRIEVQSEVGVGTTFSVYLPIAP